MEASECGAASLGIILGYYGRHEPLEDLRIACSVTRDGANAASIVRAAQSYDLEGGGKLADTDDLAQIDHPVIIHWAFQHFMVLEGVKGKGKNRVARVNDPAIGRRLIAWHEIEESFTGVVIDLVPGEGFEKRGAPVRLGPDIVERVTQSGRSLILACLATLIMIVPGLAAPFIARLWIDRGSDLSSWVILALALAVVLSALMAHVQLVQLRRSEARLTLSGTTRFLRGLLRKPMAFFLQRNPGDLTERLMSNSRVAQVVIREVVVTVSSLLLVISYGFTLFILDPLMALVCVASSVIQIFLLRLLLTKQHDAMQALLAKEASLASSTMQSIGAITSIKGNGLEDSAFSRWSGFLAHCTRENQRLSVMLAQITLAPTLLTSLTTAIIVIVGGTRLLDGALSIGLLFAFLTIFSSFSAPVQQLIGQASRLQNLDADMRRLRDVTDYADDEVWETSPSSESVMLSGALELRNVTFAFDGNVPFLEDVSLIVRPGSRVALVGSSGSGKSTLGRIIAGLTSTTSGEVLLDGKAREDLDPHSVTRAVAYIDQSITLYGGTVRENVSLWDDSIEEKSLIAALEDAEILDEVNQRAGGLDAHVADGGKNFSGGQRQRLELARALTQNPSLVILDEATSALDQRTEASIMDNLKRRGCTLVIIAHRLSTVVDADRIVVLDHGKVVESGHHHDLIALDGAYASLYAHADEEQPA